MARMNQNEQLEKKRKPGRGIAKALSSGRKIKFRTRQKKRNGDIKQKEIRKRDIKQRGKEKAI